MLTAAPIEGFFCMYTYMRSTQKKSLYNLTSEAIGGHWKSLKITEDQTEVN